MPSFPLSPANPYNIVPVLDKNGNIWKGGDTDTGVTLQKDDRSKILSGSEYSLLQYAYAMPGYSPDALIQHKGWDLCDKMFINSAYQALFSVKENAILYKPMAVNSAVQSKSHDAERYGRAVEASDFCRFLLENIGAEDTNQATDFRAVLADMIQGVHQGNSMQEINTKWIKGGKYDGLLGLSDFAYKRPRQIGYWLHKRTNRILSVNVWTANAEWDWDLPLEKFFYYCYRKRNGLPYGWGDFRPAHPHTVVLDLLMKLWVIVTERFAGGFLKGIYSNPADASSLLSILEKIKRGASVAIPEGMDIILEQLHGNGIETIGNCITYNKLQLAELILGQSLTTNQGDKGSYAHAHVHQDTQEFFLAFVRRDIEFIVETQIFKRFLNFNYGNKYDDVIPKFSLGVWNWQEINLIGDAINKFVGMGAVGARAPFIRELPGFPAFDPDTEGDLTIEPNRERVTIDESSSTPAPTGPSKKRPGTAAKAMRLSDVPPDSRVLVLPDNYDGPKMP